jgi:lysophospholipase L1-like esterase
VTNSLGFKDRAPRDVPLQSAGRRLMFIGDSFTEGIGVPWEDTWVGIVAGRLAEQDIDVLNAGVTSYCPKTAYYKTKALLAAGLQVSHLIFFIDVSDMADELIFNDFRPASPDADDVWTDRYVKTPYRPAFHQFSLTYHTILRMRGRDPWRQTVFTDRQSGASFVFTNFISEREGWTRGNQHEWLDAAQRSASYYVAKLAALCREHGIEFEIGIYPWPQEIEANETQSRYREFWLGFAAEHHIGCYDLHPVMLPPDPAARAAILAQDFIANDVHWNAAGHRLVAAEFLRQYRERHPN